MRLPFHLSTFLASRADYHRPPPTGLDLPFLLLPFRPSSDPSSARTFVRNFFSPPAGHGPLCGEALKRELRLTEPMVICSVVKWCWSRLPGGVVTWDVYELFKVGEQGVHSFQPSSPSACLLADSSV